jgi:hypothetical protein
MGLMIPDTSRYLFRGTRRDLELEAVISKLDSTKLIAARYERRSLLITAKQPFGEWGKIFADKTMTSAACAHATMLE